MTCGATIDYDEDDGHTHECDNTTSHPVRLALGQSYHIHHCGVCDYTWYHSPTSGEWGALT